MPAQQDAHGRRRGLVGSAGTRADLAEAGGLRGHLDRGLEAGSCGSADGHALVAEELLSVF